MEQVLSVLPILARDTKNVWLSLLHTILLHFSISKPLPFLSCSVSAPMAALQSLALASPVSQCSSLLYPRSFSGSIALPIYQSARSAFCGQSLRLQYPQSARTKQKPSKFITMMVKPSIQFIQGMDEQTIPDVKLTKSRDGTNGMAIFTFDEPSVFDASGELGDITGLYMIDEEGTLQSVDVSAKFVNGKPSRIEAKYVMRTPRDWDRFMRFMERYANANGLSFVKS